MDPAEQAARQPTAARIAIDRPSLKACSIAKTPSRASSRHLVRVSAFAAAGSVTQASLDKPSRATVAVTEWKNRVLYGSGRANVLLGFVAERRTDIDDYRNRQRLAFLAKAGEVLAESLDLQTTLRRLLEIIVPEFGDWAAIDLLDERNRLKTVAAIHADPRKAAIVRQLCNRYNHKPEFERHVIDALRTRRP